MTQACCNLWTLQTRTLQDLQRIRAGGFPHPSVHTCSKRLSQFQHFQQLCKYAPLLHLQGFYILLLMCHSSLCMLLLRLCWRIHARGSTGVFWKRRDEFWLTDDCVHTGSTSRLSPDKVRISVQPGGWWWLITDQPVYMMNFWLRQPHWPNM